VVSQAEQRNVAGDDAAEALSLAADALEQRAASFLFHDKHNGYGRKLLAAAERVRTIAALRSRSETAERAALTRATSLLDRMYDGGPDCDCSMDGGVHDCGWPELKATREQCRAALRSQTAASVGTGNRSHLHYPEFDS
jgi:hypothetical protein